MLKKKNLGIAVSKGYTRGFSVRLNELCDLAGLKPETHGRPSELAEITGLSRTGTRNWIKEDSIPRAGTLEVLVDALVCRIPESLDKYVVLYWLINGGESPLAPERLELSDSYFKNYSPFLVQKVFSVALSVAEEVNVDLHTFSETQLDALYSPLMHAIHQYPNLDIRDMIKSNLILAASNLR